MIVFKLLSPLYYNILLVVQMLSPGGVLEGQVDQD